VPGILQRRNLDVQGPQPLEVADGFSGAARGLPCCLESRVEVQEGGEVHLERDLGLAEFAVHLCARLRVRELDGCLRPPGRIFTLGRLGHRGCSLVGKLWIDVPSLPVGV